MNRADIGIPGRGNCECKGALVARSLDDLGNERLGGRGGGGFELGDIGGVQIRRAPPRYAMKEPRFHEQGEAGNPI